MISSSFFNFRQLRGEYWLFNRSLDCCQLRCSFFNFRQLHGEYWIFQLQLTLVYPKGYFTFVVTVDYWTTWMNLVRGGREKILVHKNAVLHHTHRFIKTLGKTLSGFRNIVKIVCSKFD